MVGHYNPFSNIPYQQTLSPQQIPTANGRESVNNIKLPPNSSVLVADSTLPLIYRCVSDSLGNVSINCFDISPHKDEEQVKKEQTEVILADLVQRIERLEKNSEKSIKTNDSIPEKQYNNEKNK